MTEPRQCTLPQSSAIIARSFDALGRCRVWQAVKRCWEGSRTGWPLKCWCSTKRVLEVFWVCVLTPCQCSNPVTLHIGQGVLQ